MSRTWFPLLSALCAFALYLATMAHVHHGDTPLYVEQILSGEWLARPHMLPRPLGAVAVAVGERVAPAAGPYPPLIVLNALAGAACVGLLHALIRRLTAQEALAAVAAAGFAVSRVGWGIATTFELALFPLVLLLIAAHLLVGARRGFGIAVAVGLAQAVAFGFHAIALAALPAWILVLAADPRPWRERAAHVAALLVAYGLGTLVLYQALITAFAPPDSLNAVGWLAQFAEPTLDAQMGRIQPASMAITGFASALSASEWGQLLAGAWLAALLIGTFRLREPLWSRYRGFAGAPAVWIAGAAAMAIRVEPGNYEYYAQALAACFVWTALLVSTSPRPRVGLTLLGGFAAALAASNLPLVLENHRSEGGGHVGVRAETSRPQPPPDEGRGPPPDEGHRPPPEEGGRPPPEDGRWAPPDEGGPVNPPPEGGPPVPPSPGDGAHALPPPEGGAHPPREDGGPVNPPPEGGPPVPPRPEEGGAPHPPREGEGPVHPPEVPPPPPERIRPGGER